ncbi:hypothetical protein IMY05_002G0023600 [Salix suchowensis]|nr:hypothetical protein IMY05_002G0023600 [Salix suchowensis]
MKAFNCMLIHFEKMILEYLSKRCCGHFQDPHHPSHGSSTQNQWATQNWLFTVDELV